MPIGNSGRLCTGTIWARLRAVLTLHWFSVPPQRVGSTALLDAFWNYEINSTHTQGAKPWFPKDVIVKDSKSSSWRWSLSVLTLVAANVLATCPAHACFVEENHVMGEFQSLRQMNSRSS
eukprot:5743539-Amphidinium_carterae.1